MSLANEVIVKDLVSTSSSNVQEAEEKYAPPQKSKLGAYPKEFLIGLKDSVQLLNTFALMIVSKRVRNSFLKLTLLNLLVYNGFCWVFRETFYRLSNEVSWLDMAHFNYYRRCMSITIHLLSYFISSSWYAQVSGDTLRIHGKKIIHPKDSIKRWLKSISQKVYRMFLVVIVLLQIYLVSLIPVVGIFLKFSLLTILCGYYCFEHKWSLLGISLANRIGNLEDSVCYFSGFGFLVILLAMMFPKVIEWGIFPTLVMANVISASMTEPARLTRGVRVLCLTQMIIRNVLKCCSVVCGRSRRTTKVKAS